MNNVTILYRYRAYDPIRHKWYVTHHMTEEDAAKRYPGAERLDYTREEREPRSARSNPMPR